MTLTLNLPDAVATRMEQLPEDERARFSVEAIADALLLIENDDDCVEVVDRALADVEAGIGLYSFEDACRRWESEKIASASPNSQ
jgi:hypothetical protein